MGGAIFVETDRPGEWVNLDGATCFRVDRLHRLHPVDGPTHVALVYFDEAHHVLWRGTEHECRERAAKCVALLHGEDVTL